jgi:aminopeptidase N
LSETEMVGFYKSSYTDGTETKYLAATQFESTHARRAFPCFDEPALKATFTVTLNFPKTYTAMSNTEISSSIPDPDDENLQRVKFKQTPLMSTYLVAFIVSEFKCTAGATVDGIPTEVCSRPGTEDTTKIAQETAPQILAAMQAYTGLSYKDFNIGKLTQAAIPDRYKAFANDLLIFLPKFLKNC